jgi:serine/threonine protein kinase
VGQRVGEFEIKRLLGRGGMGSVYEATQTTMQRDVALKVLDAGLFPSNEQVQRFEREAWIAGRLSHPNIVRVHARGEVGNSRYIAMELVEGPSLQAELKKLKPEELDQQHMRRMVELFLGSPRRWHTFTSRASSTVTSTVPGRRLNDEDCETVLKSCGS